MSELQAGAAVQWQQWGQEVPLLLFPLLCPVSSQSARPELPWLSQRPSLRHVPVYLHAGFCPYSEILPVSRDSLGKKQTPSFTGRGPAHSHLPHLSQRSGDIASQMKSAQVSTSFSSKGRTLSLQTKQEWAYGDHSILWLSRLAQAKEEGLCVTGNGISLLPAARLPFLAAAACHTSMCVRSRGKMLLTEVVAARWKRLIRTVVSSVSSECRHLRSPFLATAGKDVNRSQSQLKITLPVPWVWSPLVSSIIFDSDWQTRFPLSIEVAAKVYIYVNCTGQPWNAFLPLHLKL